MAFPIQRMRRLRRSAALRSVLRETSLSLDDLVMPLFVVPGRGVEREIATLAGHFHYSVDRLIDEVELLAGMGVKALLLFGVPDEKDESGELACRDDALLQVAIRALRERLSPSARELVLMADLCFCSHLTHGHCGVLGARDVDNDRTVEMLAKQALSLARAGIDVVAPSAMMDGMVAGIRAALDKAGFCETLIMSYSAKFSSSFYGPFRGAANSAPSFGTRETYQQDPANSDEAIREIGLDIEEGADIVMVKPALAYLDVIYRAKRSFPVPLAAYSVSGEYAMLKTASSAGLLDAKRAAFELLLSIKRAGADIIISYSTKELAPYIGNQGPLL